MKLRSILEEDLIRLITEYINLGRRENLKFSLIKKFLSFKVLHFYIFISMAFFITIPFT